MKIFKIKLHWQILIAFVLAIFFGYYIPNGIRYVSWMGDIFLRALKMVVVPLIFSSIVSGVTSINDSKNLGILSLKTMSYYISTSFIAIITGLILVNVIEPGKGVDLGFSKTVEGFAENSESLKNIIYRLIPENIIDSMAKGELLPIIFFAVLFGFFIIKTDIKYKETLTLFFESVFEVMMKLTIFIIKFTPLGIFGIVATEVNKHSADLANIAGSLALYIITVVIALLFHALISLPFLVRFIGKAKPFAHLKNMSVPLLTAFSTSSSNAALPLTMEAVENNSGVSKKIVSFTIPLGATINMNGTALYECVAAMFIAQAYGIDLNFGHQMIIVFTALLASIGAAGIPMAGLVMMVIVLSAVGLPLEGIGLILSVDRILDMLRTTVNVWGDTCGAVIIARSEKEKTNVGIY